jgi:magnesium and cobalt exporter, CNNM family
VGEAGDRPVGVVHVRDTLTRPEQTTAADLMRPVLTLPGDTPVHTALSAMRAGRNHLALVEADGELLGIVTMQDVLDRLLPAA